MFALVVLTLLLRLGTRLFLLRRVGLDDFAIVLASGAACAGLVCTWQAIEPLALLYHGDKSRIDKAKIYTLGSGYLYIWSMTFIKISLGFFFYRIFVSHLKHRIVIVIAVTIPTLLGIIYFSIGVSTCAPSAYFFGLKNCAIFPAYRNIGRVWGAQNVATDLIFPILSINLLWRSDMAKMTKVLALALLCIATFGCIASVIRLAYLAPATKLSLFTKTVYSAVWTQLEVGVGIVGANIACLRPLGRLLLDNYHKRFGVSTPWVPRVDRSATQESEVPFTMISVSTVLWRLNSVFSDTKLIGQPHDWRQDRVSAGQEIQVPPQAVLHEETKMVFPKESGKVQKDVQVHVRSIDEA
ncbi:hypothetical protein B9Z65_3938 [Elsinoe australis]|uniref:Rhodopsin domain-containing protein n=1 Tax=Elsinoe australis TaxID=40998 RepID=A0A2P7Z1D7_9PEZI|nr:hypothetical protein B9Z65_3938 [Elsinoe australis]